jgi:hypothetical protein
MICNQEAKNTPDSESRSIRSFVFFGERLLFFGSFPLLFSKLLVFDFISIHSSNKDLRLKISFSRRGRREAVLWRFLLRKICEKKAFMLPVTTNLFLGRVVKNLVTG